MQLIVGDFNLPLINCDVLAGPNDDVHTAALQFFLNNGYSPFVHESVGLIYLSPC